PLEQVLQLVWIIPLSEDAFCSAGGAAGAGGAAVCARAAAPDQAAATSRAAAVHPWNRLAELRLGLAFIARAPCSPYFIMLFSTVTGEGSAAAAAGPDRRPGHGRGVVGGPRTPGKAIRQAGNGQGLPSHFGHKLAKP